MAISKRLIEYWEKRFDRMADDEESPTWVKGWRATLQAQLKRGELIALVFLLFSSCGLVRSERSAEDLSSSKEAYEQCIRAAEKVDQCEKEKAIYDADLAEYEARHKALAMVRRAPRSTTIRNPAFYFCRTTHAFSESECM